MANVKQQSSLGVGELSSFRTLIATIVLEA